MDLEQAKKETSEKFINLKESLRYIECYLYEDLDIPEEPIRLMFGDWSVPEDYRTEKLETSFNELLKNIEVVKIFSNNEKDSQDLIAWMLHELDFGHSQTHFLGYKIPHQVDKEIAEKIYFQRLEEFENIRDNFRHHVANALQALLNNTQKSVIPKTKERTDKFIWQGEQNHLIELFRTLIIKGWVIVPHGSTPTSNARAILAAIDISLTKRKPTSDEVKSFTKSYIGEHDGKGYLHPGNPEYANMKGYIPVFDEIKAR